MKRMISAILIPLMLLSLTACGSDGPSASGSGDSRPADTAFSIPGEIGVINVRHNGTRHESEAYRDDAGTIYLPVSTLTALLSTEPAETVSVDGIALTDAVRACAEQGGSCVYDEALNALYIWTEMPPSALLEDESRISHYDLGTPDDSAISYRDFFALLDKAVLTADPSALEGWRKTLTDARASGKNMTRLEGMMGILYMAVSLGSAYSEFNTDWGPIDNALGSAVWSEADAVYSQSEPQRLLPNPDVYALGGFRDAEYIYDGNWDVLGVALRYGYGRCSRLSGKPLFDYDQEANSMHLDREMTVTEALCALSRFLDSAEAEAPQRSLSDPEALHFDTEIITAGHLAVAAEMSDGTGTELPRWNGVILGCDYETREIDLRQCELYFRKASEYGFNTVSYMLTYQTLFAPDASTVNGEMLQKLDALVAAAIKYRVRLNLLTMTLPGRWASTDFETYTSTGEFDLFTNEARQEEARAIWGLLARRYADIPGDILSFEPLWEAQNYNLSTGLPFTPYAPEDVTNVFTMLIGTIREQDDDRLILYEPTANNRAEDIIRESTAIRNAVEGAFGHVQMLTNFCDMPYVYAEMTAMEGDHIDFNNHSMFKPPYPVTIYGVQGWIDSGSPLSIDGELPEGALIDLYIGEASGGTLSFYGDGELLFNEALPAQKYETDAPLSWMYPYAKSEKQVRVVLPTDMDVLRIEYSGNLAWSGLDVILPDRYAVDRWWFPSDYDAFLVGAEAVTMEKRPTSDIQISPNGSANRITVHSDVTYTTEEIVEASNQQTIDAWGQAVSAFAPGSVVRVERAAFNIGTQYDSALRYYEDFLAMCETYQLDWLTNDMSFDGVFAEYPAPLKYAGAAYTKCADGYVLKELLELYQGHMGP